MFVLGVDPSLKLDGSLLVVSLFVYSGVVVVAFAIVVPVLLVRRVRLSQQQGTCDTNAALSSFVDPYWDAIAWWEVVRTGLRCWIACVVALPTAVLGQVAQSFVTIGVEALYVLCVLKFRPFADSDIRCFWKRNRCRRVCGEWTNSALEVAAATINIAVLSVGIATELGADEILCGVTALGFVGAQAVLMLALLFRDWGCLVCFRCRHYNLIDRSLCGDKCSRFAKCLQPTSADEIAKLVSRNRPREARILAGILHAGFKKRRLMMCHAPQPFTYKDAAELETMPKALRAPEWAEISDVATEFLNKLRARGRAVGASLAGVALAAHDIRAFEEAAAAFDEEYFSFVAAIEKLADEHLKNCWVVEHLDVILYCAELQPIAPARGRQIGSRQRATVVRPTSNSDRQHARRRLEARAHGVPPAH